MNREEDSIDLGKMLSIMIKNKKNTGGIVAVCTVLAVIVSFVLPKTYTSRVMIQTCSSQSGNSVLAAITGATTNKTVGYIEIMKSRTVLEPIISSVYDDMDVKEQPTVDEFVKSNLDIKNTKGTNLIQIDAKGRTPEEAHEIAQLVVDNFLKLMTDMNYQSQSLKETDEAAQELENYSKQHKIYGTDKQIATTSMVVAEAAELAVKEQQTMDFMDIQVVDSASMPREDKPSGPRKKLIIFVGMVLGCVISLGYSLVLYKREVN